mmetsp:Transcript_37339/g.37805  ORF Transcript_37339/g.37805 Transcript_37339/m.37805 type:complete len:156 (-) Transcript_37339:126-593(-)
MEMNDSEAIYRLSAFYSLGEGGLPKDPQKGFELCLRSAKLGNSNACNDVAIDYKNGTGVPTNMAKAKEYDIKAANKGCIQARHYLGIEECKNDNDHSACRHWLLSAAAGYTVSLKKIAICYRYKLVTKNEYSTALVSYRKVNKDEWSIERERHSV